MTLDTVSRLTFVQSIIGVIIIGLWGVLIGIFYEMPASHHWFSNIALLAAFVTLIIPGFFTMTGSKKKNDQSFRLFADVNFYCHIIFIFLNFFITVNFLFYANHKTLKDSMLKASNYLLFSVAMGIFIYIILQLRKQQAGFDVLHLKLKDKLKELTDLQSVGMALNSVLELERLLNLILDMTVQILKVEIVTLFLIDQDRKELSVKIARGMAEDTQKKVKIQVGKGIIGTVAMTGQSMLIEDIDNSEYKKTVAVEKSERSKYNSKSLICVPLMVKKEVIGVLSLNNKHDGKPFTDEDLEMSSILASQAAVAIENANLYKTMHETYLETVKALSAAIDAKDAYTAGHSLHVTQYIVPIAHEMGLDKESIEKLEYAGLLHDIGKIGIIESILNKKGRLTDEEFEIIKQHPVIGANIINSVEFLKDVVDLVRHHHERFDGRGYPSGLKETEIPLGARIIAVADTFDAMTSDRPYRKGLPYAVAVDEIKRCAGSQFDPEVADAFIKAYEKGTLNLTMREQD